LLNQHLNQFFDLIDESKKVRDLVRFRPIISEELSLEVMTAVDVKENYVQWLNNSQVNRFLQVRFNDVNLKSQQDYVTKIYNSGDACLFGIYTKDRNMIGTIKIGPIDFKNRSGEIGIMIGEQEAWGKGYASKSIGMLCEAFFTEGILSKVTAGVSERNIGSMKAFEKNGFLIEGFLENQCVDAESGPHKVFRYGKTARTPK
jgi:RimJ/RimL family protein N-acetyltransferase